jgi:gamma-glutamyltranspeptidase/glutathione hydrolase
MALPTLAATLRHIAAEGPAWLYEGSFAARAAAHVRDYGGWLDAEDFARHESEWTTPISTVYRGLRVHECPPNGQGLAALVALNALNAADLDGRNETEILVRHLECMRLGFQAAGRAVCDPAWAKEDVGRLLEPARGRALLADVDPSRAFAGPLFGRTGSDTVHAAVVDGEGNACSWIQSCYMGTGTGLVVPGTGVSLQNRGAGFSLDPDHPNTLEGGKRPYHTIIPAMVTVDGALHACFGVVGGFMQPQGHVQVVTHLAAGRNPQQALDAARWQLEGHGARVLLEPGFPAHVVRALQDRGYVVREVDGFERVHMGGGQVIVRDAESGVLAGGSDPRRDGCAIGF